MSYRPRTSDELNMNANAVPSSVAYRHGQPAIAHGGFDPNALMAQFGAMNLGGMGMTSGHGPVPMPGLHGWMLGHGPESGVLSPAMHPVHHHLAATHNTDNPYALHMTAPGSLGSPIFGFPMPLYATPEDVHNYRRADRVGHADVPGLENRRGSYSTTESTPATPFWTGMSRREPGTRVAASLTPSPQHLGMPNLNVDVPKRNHVAGIHASISTLSEDEWDELLRKSPEMPPAVPAVFTPLGQMKSLEQSLENRIPGNRNVYIRGLHPTTDDNLLAMFANRFGQVETSKAIIDTATGACKGFGFAKFADVRDSEKCIRGFHRLGYEVGFARESFNSRLKAEGDDGSTNLYISNLPKNFTEVELSSIFLGFNILSSKILRDSMGHSRGVGFARFESREVCSEVIDQFNGMAVGGDEMLVNIRFADTPAQKELKRITAERRQFRTNEYNIGAYGTPLVGMSPTMYSLGSNWRRSAGLSRSDPATYMRDDTRQPGSQLGESRTVTTTSTDVGVSTPTSSECDEGVTIHADPVDNTVTSLSTQLSPSIKKETVKREVE